MKDLARIKASKPCEEITRTLQEEGAVIVEELLDPDLVRRFNEELDPVLERAHAGAPQKHINDAVAWFFGDRMRHVTAMAAKSRLFATEILTHPTYLAICDAVLLPNCARYQLNIAHVLDRGPGSEQQLLHRDQDVWIHLPRPHPEIQLASVLALVDFTADNGATRIIPGSHRWEDDQEVNEDELVAAEMSAGSAVVYLGSTVHAGGANITSDQWRRGMHISYCVGWLRTEENQYLSMPLETARRLPRESQELLGFAAHDAIEIGGGYLGTVDLQDPVELIASGGL
jgi:ectoine hydroxylase-related dioxygenase (phytanoyl-CoA dioxygenase family)